MKEIRTLIPDIYSILKKKDGWLTEETANSFGVNLGFRLKEQLGKNSKRNTLRLSQMGVRCPRELWYSIHHPELAEPLPPWTEVKFAYGHMVEELAIALVKAAGHKVEGEQDALELNGIVGHRDCVIDGCIVDVKSTSSLSFKKFKSKDFSKADNFGYLDQLDGYVVASHDDPIVTVKDRGYILAIDRQIGHMVLYEHIVREQLIRDRIVYYKSIVARDTPPPCECRVIPYGQSGNMGLDVKASYSAYKFCCFPLLRTFLYSGKPVYLTKVVRIPDVKEITKYRKRSH